MTGAPAPMRAIPPIVFSLIELPALLGALKEMHRTFPPITFRRHLPRAMLLTLLAMAISLSLGHTLAAAQQKLDEAFEATPPEARPWVYWYWMNGNVTREGIHADFRAFADVGVGGVLTFDIGIHPAGTVTNRSREWFGLVKFATEEAAKHGIKMSFHCPGWSASGGPWITPELAMQELTWSETTVEGPKEFTAVLPQPTKRLDYYRDVALVAFPTPPGDDPLPKPQFASADGKLLGEAAAVMDGDWATQSQLPLRFDLLFEQPVEARSIFLRVGRASGDFHAQLLAWEESKTAFTPVAKIQSHLSGPFSAHIGAATFRAVRARKFRLEFERGQSGDWIVIEEMELRGSFRLTNWTSKAGFATANVAASPDDAQPLPDEKIALDRVVDLTDKLDARGRLTWQAPAGRWTILRLGHTPTGVKIYPAPVGGEGLECDKLSREAADFHYDRCVKPLLEEFGPDLAKQTMAFYHVDSFEAGWQNWSAKFPREFRERRGYDLTGYLPVLTGRVVGDRTTSEKFLWDFRRTIGDLFADHHYGRLARRCHADGIGFSTEPYGGAFEGLQVSGRADHPMVEFWLPTNPQSRKVPLIGVLAGHTTGRRIIGAEAFTSGPPEERWDSHPFALKALGDYFYCCGVNRFVIHVSAHQPLTGEHLRPGFTCGLNGIHFDRGNTWWEHGAREWTTYLSRCQAMLQSGEHVADVLYFQGNDSPDGAGPFEPELPEGYDFDACNGETLARLRVQDGRVVLPDGKNYGYLVLPHHGRVTLAAMRRIAALARDGAKIVGTIPTASPSLADAAGSDEYLRLAKELAGRVDVRLSFKDILTADKLPPDCEVAETSGMTLHWIHRRVGEAEVYFVANACREAGTAECLFRVSGKNPELWRPDTGSREPCAVYEPTGSRTRIPLSFDAAGSVFVVFRPGTAKPHACDVAFAGAANAALTIRKAVYGVQNDPQRCRDVTRELAARIKNGRIAIRNFEQLVDDPAPFVVKRIKVAYAIGDEPGSIELKDGETLILPLRFDHPPYEMRSDGEQLELVAWEAGRYKVRLPNERTRLVEVSSVTAPQIIAGPWLVQFPEGWGAPAKLTLDQLISWPDHSDAGVRHFSGTATYRTTFQHHRRNPNARIYLDLGRVEIIAEVRLNGKSLGTLWKPPFRCEVTDILKAGTNDLEVRVTNLWPNRLIGDEQFPDDCVNGRWLGGGIPAWPEWLFTGQPRPEARRQTFAAWKHWKPDDALLPSGLLGPVNLLEPEKVEVKYGR
jgi:hypothetical protein